MAGSIAFVTSAVDAADRATYTFASQSFGAEASDRYIVLTIASRATGNRTISSVSIGGVSASPAAFINESSTGGASQAAIYVAHVPTGTSGTVEVSFANTCIRCGIGIFRATGITGDVTSFATSGLNDSPGVSLDVDAGGVAVGILFTDDSTGSWTGLTEDFNQVIEGNFRHRGASASFATAQVGLSVGIDASSQHNAFAAAAFEPAPLTATRALMHYRRLRI